MCWGNGSGTAVTSLFGGTSQQVRWSHLQGHELDLTHTDTAVGQQRSGSLSVYTYSWSANAADGCEMPVHPTGDLKGLGPGQSWR